MADRKNAASHIRDLVGSARRKNEAHALRRRLVKCEDELSLELERFGEACFAGDADAEKRRDSVAALRAEADALTRRIDELAGVLRCPDCALELADTDAYCRRCGRAMKRQVSSNAQIVWPDE